MHTAIRLFVNMSCILECSTILTGGTAVAQSAVHMLTQMCALLYCTCCYTTCTHCALQVLQLAWRRDVDGCSNMAYATQTASSYIQSVTNASDTASRRYAQTRLGVMQQLQKIEIAALVNASGQIAGAADNLDTLIGQHWDPGKCTYLKFEVDNYKYLPHTSH
jgi:hypothetical protein